MTRTWFLSSLWMLLASPAFAQHRHEQIAAPAQASPASPSPEVTEQAVEAMPAMDWPTEIPAGDSTMPESPIMDHAAHVHQPKKRNPVGNASPPPQPASFAADSVFDPGAMARARAQLHSEHGGSAALSKVTINLAEWQVQDGQNSYRWGGEAWIGGDLQRLVFKSEGEGAAEEGLEQAELQALYSAAIDPYFDLQFGIRQDLASGPRRTYATMGVEGLAPYWVDLQAAAFLSTHGEVLARLEASWDLRLTQRWILQTRAEADLSAQTVPALELGSGLTSLEAGLRLRYQTTRRVAPYFGISSVRMFGGTASRARLTGRDVEQTGLIFGVTAWF